MALIDKVKVACRVTSTTYDDELAGLISASFADMGITDIKSDMLAETAAIDPLVQNAVITFCKMNFGFVQLAEGQYERLKEAYDEQKSQMLMSSKYTDWGDADA